MERVGGWVAWWLGLAWLWVLLSGEWNVTEWVAAAIAATTGATNAVVAHADRLLSPRFRPGSLRAAARLPLQVVLDLGILLLALARRRTGIFKARPTRAAGTDILAASRRAWLTLAAGYSPNAYVLDIDADDGTALLHDLVSNRRSEEPL